MTTCRHTHKQQQPTSFAGIPIVDTECKYPDWDCLAEMLSPEVKKASVKII